MCRTGSILSPWQLLKPTLYMLSFLNPAGNTFDNEHKAAFPHEHEFAREKTFTNLWKDYQKNQEALSSLKNAQHTWTLWNPCTQKSDTINKEIFWTECLATSQTTEFKNNQQCYPNTHAKLTNIDKSPCLLKNNPVSVNTHWSTGIWCQIFLLQGAWTAKPSEFASPLHLSAKCDDFLEPREVHWKNRE